MKIIILMCMLSLNIVIDNKLSLDECIRISLTNSDEVKIGNEKERDAREGVNEYRAPYWPKISFTSEALLEERMEYSYSNNIKARWAVFDSGKRSVGLKKAEQDYLSSQWQEKFISQEVIFSTASAYIQMARCEEICLLSQEVLAEEKRRLKIVEAKSEEGIVPKLDVVTIEAEIRQAQISLSKARSDLKTSRVLLNHAMGLDMDKVIEIEEIDPPWWNALIDKYMDIKDCFNKAFLNRIDYKIAACKLEREQANLKEVGAEAGPKIFLDAGYYPSSIQSTEKSSNFVSGLTLDIPLFEGGLRKAQIERAKAQVEIVKFERQKLKKEIYKEIAGTYEKLRNLQEGLRLQEEKLSLLSKKLEAQESLYNEGMTDINNLNDANQDYVNCRLKLTELKCDILLSFLLLLREIGVVEVIL
ncbi:MAG: TolC family protein [Candidatus Omnitrophica bacterium]|nr:TolC family protein [Candidatus Omnitrophota bacterium]